MDGPAKIGARELESLHVREVTTADGKKLLCPYAGPVELSFGNRTCYVGALVLRGEERPSQAWKSLSVSA